MVQGGNKQKSILIFNYFLIGMKQNSKRKEQKVAPKIKNYRETTGRNEDDYVSNTIHRKVKEHKKKIYKSIEQTIVDNAKKNRERFELI